MNKTWTAAALAISAIVWSPPGMAQHGYADPPKCSARTLYGSYVLALTGFVIVAGVPQPKAVIEQVNFDGQGSGVGGDSARAVNGDPLVLGSGGNASYALDDKCSGNINFPGVTHFLLMDPDGDKGWTLLQSPTGNVFQGILTRVGPLKGHDERH